VLHEGGVANFGLVAFLLFLIGMGKALRERAWWPLAMLAVAGLLLSLGLTLKWDDVPIQAPWFSTVKDWLWRVGHSLKPGLFEGSSPPAPFEAAIPLPSWLFTLAVPLWEGVRTVSRWIFVAAIGYFPIVVLGLSRLRHRGVQLLVVALLVIEILPPPQHGTPLPDEGHPAFEWLAGQTLGEQGILDLFAPTPGTLDPLMGGETLWATLYHGQPTAAGAGSMLPPHTVRLIDWFRATPHPLRHPDLVPFLQEYQIRYLLIHVRGEHERLLFEEALENPSLASPGCFEHSESPSIWYYPICVVEIPAP
jgi:hypothetical protein